MLNILLTWVSMDLLCYVAFDVFIVILCKPPRFCLVMEKHGISVLNK